MLIIAPLILATAVVAQPPPPYYFARPLVPGGVAVPVREEPPRSPVGGDIPGDPYHFTTWLNLTRAMYGLEPLTYDRELERWAARNNEAQRVWGVGHHVRGPAYRQNAAVVTGNVSQFIGLIWMDSDDHWPALLDPNIRRHGIAWDGKAYWTWNAR